VIVTMPPLTCLGPPTGQNSGFSPFKKFEKPQKPSRQVLLRPTRGIQGISHKSRTKVLRHSASCSASSNTRGSTRSRPATALLPHNKARRRAKTHFVVQIGIPTPLKTLIAMCQRMGHHHKISCHQHGQGQTRVGCHLQTNCPASLKIT
jgi:hypothetical protein